MPVYKFSSFTCNFVNSIAGLPILYFIQAQYYDYCLVLRLAFGLEGHLTGFIPFITASKGEGRELLLTGKLQVNSFGAILSFLVKVEG